MAYKLALYIPKVLSVVGYAAHQIHFKLQDDGYVITGRVLDLVRNVIGMLWVQRHVKRKR